MTTQSSSPKYPPLYSPRKSIYDTGCNILCMVVDSEKLVCGTQDRRIRVFDFDGENCIHHQFDAWPIKVVIGNKEKNWVFYATASTIFVQDIHHGERRWSYGFASDQQNKTKIVDFQIDNDEIYLIVEISSNDQTTFVLKHLIVDQNQIRLEKEKIVESSTFVLHPGDEQRQIFLGTSKDAHGIYSIQVLDMDTFEEVDINIRSADDFNHTFPIDHILVTKKKRVKVTKNDDDGSKPKTITLEQTIISADQSGRVIYWTFCEGNVKFNFQRRIANANTKISSMRLESMISEQHLFLLTPNDQTIHQWNATSGEIIRTYTQDSKINTFVVIGNYIYSGGNMFKLYEWNTKDNIIFQHNSPDLSNSATYCRIASDDVEFIYTGTRVQGVIEQRNALTGAVKKNFGTMGADVRDLQVFRHGQVSFVVALSEMDQMFIWEYNHFTESISKIENSSWAKCCKVFKLRDTNLVWIRQDEETNIHHVDLLRIEDETTAKIEDEPVHAVDFFKDKTNIFFSLVCDKKIVWFDISSRRNNKRHCNIQHLTYPSMIVKLLNVQDPSRPNVRFFCYDQKTKLVICSFDTTRDDEDLDRHILDTVY